MARVVKLWHTQHIWPYLLEAFVCLLHTPPGCSDWISDSFGLVMLLRFYLVLRLLRDSNHVYNNNNRYKESDPNQARSCHSYGTTHKICVIDLSISVVHSLHG